MKADRTARDNAVRIALIKKEIDGQRGALGVMPSFVDENGEPNYGRTTVTPDKLYSHPRVWVNADTLPKVISGLSIDENEKLFETVRLSADLDYTGILGSELQYGDNRNFCSVDIVKIESLAFLYLTTGDELCGYCAIRAAKNFLDTVRVRPDRSTWTGMQLFDISNLSSCAMGIIAEVYDWCYPLLTEQDKEYIVRAVTTKLTCNLEVANPPKNTGCVTGHSTHILTLRDWPSFAIAVADEYPEIYEYIYGLVENYYAPAANWYYPSGANFQGATYGINKTHLHIISDHLIRTASGAGVYDKDLSFEPTALTFVHYLRPDEETMRIGDVNINGKVHGPRGMSVRMFLYGAAYSKNPQLRAWAKYLSDGYSSIRSGERTVPVYNGNLEVTPVKVLLLNDATVTAGEEQRLSMPLVNYNGSPSGAIIARNKWGDPDAWFTFTKIGEAYGANHEHRDAGTFQIYYKGILALNSSTYNYNGYKNTCYGDPLDLNYNKQTISKNGLLVYNPSHATEPLAKWGYSGGQSTDPVTVKENATLDQWLSKRTSHQARVLAHASGFGKDGSLEYAYISGDITNAYDEDTVSLVLRSTVSINTGDAAHPLLFVVHDKVTSKDPSFRKTFLLHTTGRPEFVGGKIGEDCYFNPTVTGARVFSYTNSLGAAGSYKSDIPDDKYNGRLTCTTLLPEDPTYTVIGGDGRRFFVDGINYSEELPGEITPQSEIGWGRVELSPGEARLTDTFLNVMYVSDADKEDVYIPAELVCSKTHEGVCSMGYLIMLGKTTERVASPVSFVASVDGEIKCIVTGLKGGRWQVSTAGRSFVAVCTEESGVIDFKAKPGEIKLEYID